MVKKKGEFISISALIALFLLPTVSAAPLDRLSDLLKDALGRVFFDFTRVGQSTFDLWIRILIFFILFSLLYLILPFVPIFGQGNNNAGRTYLPQARRMGVVVAFALAFMSAVMIPSSVLVAIASTYGWIASILFLLGPLVGIVIAINISPQLSTAANSPHRARNALFHGLIYYLFATILHNFMQAVRTAGSSLNLSQFIEWGEFVEAIVLLAAIIYFILALVWAFSGDDNQQNQNANQQAANQNANPQVQQPQQNQGGNQQGQPQGGQNPQGQVRPQGNPQQQQPVQPIPPLQPIGPVQNFQVIPGDREALLTWQPPAVGTVAQYHIEGRPTGFIGRFRNGINEFRPGAERNFRAVQLQNGTEWQFRIQALGVSRGEEGPWSRWQQARIGPRVTPPQFAQLLNNFDQQIQQYQRIRLVFQQTSTTFAQLPAAQRRRPNQQQLVLQSMANLFAHLQTITATYTLIQQQFLQFSPADRARFLVLQGDARQQSNNLVQFLTPQIIQDVGAHCPFIINIIPPQFP